MVYYGVLIGLSILMYFYLRFGSANDKKRADEITLTFFFLSYLLLLCLRDESVGADTRNYIYRFNLIQNMGWHELFSIAGAGSEFGFIILNKLISIFGGPRLLIIIVSAIIVIPVLILYKNEADDAMFCISFFLISLLFGMFFSGMRQSIAISLGVPAFYCVKNKRKMLFFLVVVLAFSFHRTAIMLLLLYPIYHARIIRKWLWFVIPILVLVYVYRDIVFSFASLYLENTVYTNYTLLTGTSGQGALSILFMLLSIYCYVIMDESLADSEDIGLRNIMLLATTVHLFSPLNPVVARINMYFILFIPVAVSRANLRRKILYNQVVTLATIIMEAYFVIHFLLSNGSTTRFENYMFFF